MSYFRKRKSMWNTNWMIGIYCVLFIIGVFFYYHLFDDILYVAITGMKYYYDLKPFKVGKRIKCVKEPSNAYDSDAIKVTMKEIGTVGYIANAPYTSATGTMTV